MDEITAELNELFAGGSPDGLPRDVLAELRSIMDIHALSPQELFFKWESYSMKMGEETQLNLDTARALKQDIQDTLERESRGKGHLRPSEKRSMASAAPRALKNNQDVFDMLGDLVPNTPHTAAKPVKRKAGFDTPLTSKASRGGDFSSPLNARTPIKLSGGASNLPAPTPFSERKNNGEILETLNPNLPAAQAPVAPYSEARIKLAANTDIKKFSYKPMAMKLSECSEVLDDRIDEFAAVYQKQHSSDDTPFGNAAHQSTREVIAVGRIASDSMEGRLNTASLVFEMSRRTGAGLRVPLKVDSLPSVQLFPGQIVAIKGINASGEYFSALEVLQPPFLPPAASSPEIISSINERLSESGSAPLNILVASGPYTTDDNLNFEPLNELCAKAAEQSIDTLVLTGPFLDIEHPLIATGDFDLPEINGLDPDTATLSVLFRYCISRPLHRLAMAVPSITIVLVPSVRDAVNRHVSWPQDMLPRLELGLPKQVRMVPNPVTISLNESVFGLCSYDVLYELRREEVLGGKPTEGNLLTRLSRYLIEQRHFSPVFPPSAREHLPKSGTENGIATGAMLDLRYLKLGEWWNVQPDVLIIPSVLPPFVKVIEGVLVINPGTVSKRRGPGTYAQLAVHPRVLTEEEQNAKYINHRLFERARVDIIRI
ncbi:DNA polymerase alpha/primase associated subunit [Coccidioides immitis RS]|uniref:DNA polymerase alpha subunit B n=4 Tax=Coccidioides immitis TaxID=5501 RepID=J3K1Z7_COCIM|nr:DNA polymerase alpha/primase associated subunit [Coccidioides immitis RS]KMP08877.1 DNA polymerase alpha 70 kDa subunit [Coccidioides immitis RMSCC 2394]KMU81998.1 DNA polymerase alpha subunit [Coccidioides immitis RMSCC 3703]KMU89114.1 DNA polymerase alpha 70 kDa subunit [Coccidioides immitis H538.4]TPX20728.1 DNA-directed DNA polymerase alpha subunit pol12 [Coccidioides immitis]EAS28066.3 DNA polymerase alpha/primase associated subunit [Coccidioides immitis RS]